MESSLITSTLDISNEFFYDYSLGSNYLLRSNFNWLVIEREGFF